MGRTAMIGKQGIDAQQAAQRVAENARIEQEAGARRRNAMSGQERRGNRYLAYNSDRLQQKKEKKKKMEELVQMGVRTTPLKQGEELIPWVDIV